MNDTSLGLTYWIFFLMVDLGHYGNPIIDWDKGHLHVTDGDIYR